jgi:protein-tyrosine phosphatase
VIDLHCHVLPGIDDGPPTLAGAVELARAQLASRVTTVAATPHITPDLDNDSASVATGVAALRDALAEADLPLDVIPGGEVDLAWAAALPDDELAALSLGGGGWILLEAPLRQRPGVPEAVRAVLARGHRILLGHPERSPAFQRDPKALAALVRDGVRVQVTATALTGSFGSAVSRYAVALAGEGLCHVVASDAHAATHRPPGLIAEVAAAGLEAHAATWCEAVPAAILAGDDVPEHVAGTPAAGRRRRPWRR